MHVPRSLIISIAAAAVLPLLALTTAGTATAAPATRPAPARAPAASPSRVRPAVLTGATPDAQATPGPSFLCTSDFGCLVDPGLNKIFYTGPEGTFFTFTREGYVNKTTGFPFNSSAYAGVYGGYPYYLVRVNGGAYCIGDEGYGSYPEYPAAESCKSTYDQWIVLLPQNGYGSYWLVDVGASNDYGHAPYGAEADGDNSFCGTYGAIWYLYDQSRTCSNDWTLFAA